MITRLFRSKIWASSSPLLTNNTDSKNADQNKALIQDLSHAINTLLNDIDNEFTNTKLANIDLAFEKYHSAGGHLAHFEPKINKMQNPHSQTMARASLLERMEPDMTNATKQKKKI